MANDLNHVTVIGRLTRDSELKYTPTGMAVAKFAIAVNTSKKVDDKWVGEANFFDITLWGKTAETLNQYLTKGKQIAVQGELHQNRWEKDGQAHSKIEIKATDIQLLGGNDKERIQSKDELRQELTGKTQGESEPFVDDCPF